MIKGGCMNTVSCLLQKSRPHTPCLTSDRKMKRKLHPCQALTKNLHRRRFEPKIASLNFMFSLLNCMHKLPMIIHTKPSIEHNSPITYNKSQRPSDYMTPCSFISMIEKFYRYILDPDWNWIEEAKTILKFGSISVTAPLRTNPREVPWKWTYRILSTRSDPYQTYLK